MFAQVVPSPEISFPHAAMTIPAPSSTTWLQPLTSALKSLDRRQCVREQRPHKDKKDRRLHHDGMLKEVVPRFVSPVWECLSHRSKLVPVDGDVDAHQGKHMTLEGGEEDYIVGGGGCWLLRSKSKTPRF